MAVITAVANVLAHVPGLVRYGSKPTRDLARTPGLIDTITRHLRSYEDALAYPPNQAYVGGIEPEQLIARVWQEHFDDFSAFHVAFDNYGSTNSAENKESAQSIYRTLKANGLIEVRSIEQYYDPVKNMFLPDRFIKGECPKCHAKDQYGDSCESCGAVYAPTELKNPYSALSGATPVLRTSEHYFFKLSDPRCIEFLENWTAEPGRLQPEVLNKIKEWFAKDEEGNGGLGDWDISRDAPYFGIEIPDAPGKYFYVWLDAPIGYLASLKNHFAKGQDAVMLGIGMGGGKSNSRYGCKVVLGHGTRVPTLGRHGRSCVRTATPPARAGDGRPEVV